MANGSKNSRTAFGLMSVVVVMVGLSYAAVPFYDWFCRVTGFGGTTNVATENQVDVHDEVVTIRFDANIAPGMPWDFRPQQRTMEIRIGETGLAFYTATNNSDEPVAGSASYNVAPYSAGGYFSKIDCFCFEMQVLQPGESIDMPVSFYVDPEILEDREAKDVNYITLSYTMHRAELPEDYVARSAGEIQVVEVELASGSTTKQ